MLANFFCDVPLLESLPTSVGCGFKCDAVDGNPAKYVSVEWLMKDFQTGIVLPHAFNLNDWSEELQREAFETNQEYLTHPPEYYINNT